MHKTGCITTLVLLALTPVAIGAQDSAQRAAVGAKTEPAAVPPIAARSVDSLSLSALQSRVLELEQQRPDRVAEVAKWIAFAVIGIFFSVAWQNVRKTEKEERSETTLRELMTELAKEPSGRAAIEKSLQESVTKFERAASQITDVGTRADAALRLINDRLSHTSERLVDIQQKLDVRAPNAVAKGQSVRSE